MQNYIKETVESYTPAVQKAANYVTDSVKSTLNYGSQQVQNAMEFGSGMIHGATTTVTAMTPGPILNLIESITTSAQAIREDPVGSVKGYVPTFVIHAGEKTYEIVSHTADSTMKNVEATSGFIVTRVNGVVTAVSNVPVIQSLMDQLNSVKEKVEKEMNVEKQDVVEHVEKSMEEDAAEM